MTTAFNLSQLANNLDTSGKLDATDGLYGALPVANGGTGASTLTANNVILGNGTSAVQLVAPGSSGNALISNGTTWQSVAGVAQSSFTGSNQSLASSGYQKFPGGLIIQWGTVTLSTYGGTNNNFYSYSGSVTFPIAFVSACYNVNATVNGATFYAATVGVSSISTTTATFTGNMGYANSSTVPIYWIAIGK